MWIKLENGDAVNLSQATDIFYVENVGDGYKVFATMPEEELLLQIFDNEDDAVAFIEMLVDCLNGVKPIEYAFSWLTKLKAPKPAEPAKTKKVDVDLVDGVPF